MTPVHVFSKNPRRDPANRDVLLRESPRNETSVANDRVVRHLSSLHEGHVGANPDMIADNYGLRVIEYLACRNVVHLVQVIWSNGNALAPKIVSTDDHLREAAVVQLEECLVQGCVLTDDDALTATRAAEIEVDIPDAPPMRPADAQRRPIGERGSRIDET